MHALLYRSRARPGIMAADLNQIIETAQGRNRQLDVTGLLLYGELPAVPGAPGEFVQWVEGPEEAVEELYGLIESDARHFDIETLARGTVRELTEQKGVALADGRLFPAWSMGLVRPEALSPEDRAGIRSLAEVGAPAHGPVGHLLATFHRVTTGAAADS